jgi:hypothetical protein
LHGLWVMGIETAGIVEAPKQDIELCLGAIVPSVMDQNKKHELETQACELPRSRTTI